jgi:preprotein translocase subunit SecD
VLIFARIREEINQGAPPQTAINNGFERALVTILDANITTLIVAVILYAIGTGPIKGFAVTLSVGIVTSMFSSIMGTRALVNVIYGGRRVRALSIGALGRPATPLTETAE